MAEMVILHIFIWSSYPHPSIWLPTPQWSKLRPLYKQNVCSRSKLHHWIRLMGFKGEDVFNNLVCHACFQAFMLYFFNPVVLCPAYWYLEAPLQVVSTENFDNFSPFTYPIRKLQSESWPNLDLKICLPTPFHGNPLWVPNFTTS